MRAAAVMFCAYSDCAPLSVVRYAAAFPLIRRLLSAGYINELSRAASVTMLLLAVKGFFHSVRSHQPTQQRVRLFE
jgi:hypothetical protein